MSMTSASAEQAAYDILNCELPGTDCSLVEYKGVIYYALYDSTRGVPGTATTQLVQYLFDEYVDQTFFILRQRIYATEEEASFAANMVRLAAKRVTFGLRPKNHGIEITAKFVEVAGAESGIIKSRHLKEIPHRTGSQCNDLTAPAILRQLVDQVPRGPILHDHNRAIAAVLTDSFGNILEVCSNQNHKNKTLHAELLLAQNYFRRTGRKIPRDSRLYVSLKPCIMCAGALLEFSEDVESLKVYFLNDDPGPKAKNSDLERMKLLTQLKS